MSSGSLSNTLRQYRPLLLACEAIGWLHMAGKAKADFLRGHGGQPSNYEYKRWLNFEFPASQWESLIQWVQKQYPLGNNAWPASLTDFITKHTERTSGLLGLLQAGHGMASGIEKNLPSSTSAYLGQSATHMWLTSPFGHPVRNLLADPPQVLTDQGWQDLLCRIAKLLKDLQALGAASSSTPDDWWRWREEAVGPGGWLRQAFLSTLAETRLPNNDVTLWDQSYVAAALFKAAVAGAVLVGSGFNWRDNSVKQQTRWRVLTVGFGTRHYEARAVKIGDWTGARQDIERFFTKVRKLVEVDLAVGALIYRDDETLAFTFPGLRLDNNAQQSLDNNQAEHLRHEIEAEIDRLAQDHAFETPPCCVLSTSTRSFVPMVAELRRVRD
ncbi:MAG: CRISPR-associated protein Csx11, partial [Gemmataceae bacterium]